MDDIKEMFMNFFTNMDAYLKENKVTSETYKELVETALRPESLQDYDSIISKVLKTGGIEIGNAITKWSAMSKEKMIDALSSASMLYVDQINELNLVSNNKMAQTLRNFSDIMQNVMINSGMSDANYESMRENIGKANVLAAQLGVEHKVLIEYQKEFNKELRTSAPLMQKELELMVKLQQATGYDRFSKMTADMLKYGNSLPNIEKNTMKILSESAKYGLNLRNVMKNVDETLKESQKVNFQNGIQGLSSMVMQAEKLKVNLAEAFSGIEKAKDLEGAFEMATKFQMLGMDVDALQMNYLANNDPEGFMNMINEQIKGIGMLNKATGEMVYSAVDNKILAEFAKASDMSLASLKEQASQLGKVEQIRRRNSSLTQEDAQYLAQIAKYEDGRYKVTTANNQILNVERVTRAEIAKMQKLSFADAEERAKEGMGFSDIAKSAELQNVAREFLIKDVEKELQILKEGIQDAVGAGLALGMSEDNAEAFGYTLGVAMFKGADSMIEKTMKEGGDNAKRIRSLQNLFGGDLLERNQGNKFERREQPKPAETPWFSDWFNTSSLPSNNPNLLDTSSLALGAGNAIKDGMASATPDLAKAIKEAIIEGFKEAKGLGSVANVSVNVTNPQQKVDGSYLDAINGVYEGLKTKGYSIGNVG